MAKKGNRIQVILECTEHAKSGLPGTSRYVTQKNRKNTTERLELKCKEVWIRRHGSSNSSFSVLAGLTNVPASGFPILTGSNGVSGVG
jgi:large subunit ribosomal protein L33